MKATIAVLISASLSACLAQGDPTETRATVNRAAAETEKSPAIDVTKPESLIGLPVGDVEAACKAAGVRCRVVEVDGEPRPVTKDFRPDRLNFKVAGGKITAVTKG